MIYDSRLSWDISLNTWWSTRNITTYFPHPQLLWRKKKLVWPLIIEKTCTQLFTLTCSPAIAVVHSPRLFSLSFFESACFGRDWSAVMFPATVTTAAMDLGDVGATVDLRVYRSHSWWLSIGLRGYEFGWGSVWHNCDCGGRATITILISDWNQITSFQCWHWRLPILQLQLFNIRYSHTHDCRFLAYS